MGSGLVWCSFCHLRQLIGCVVVSVCCDGGGGDGGGGDQPTSLRVLGCSGGGRGQHYHHHHHHHQLPTNYTLSDCCCCCREFHQASAGEMGWATISLNKVAYSGCEGSPVKKKMSKRSELVMSFPVSYTLSDSTGQLVTNSPRV